MAQMSGNARSGNALYNGDRIRELIDLQLLDTAPEPCFDRLTRIAARALQVPIVLMSLVDDRRQFFKSSFGLPEPWQTILETPLSHSFCRHVVARGLPLVVNDARLDPLVASNPAISLLNVIAYLGVPLTAASNHTLGSCCAIAPKPTSWTRSDQNIMKDVAACVMDEIAHRCALIRDRESDSGGHRTTHAPVAGALRPVPERGSHQTLSSREQPSVVLPVIIVDRGPGDLRFHLQAGTTVLQGCLQLFRVTPDASHAIRLVGQMFDVRDAPPVPQTTPLDGQRAKLTARQRAVFDLLMRGLQTKDVAKELGLSPRTVEVHRANILRRLDAGSFTQLLQDHLARSLPR